MFEPWKGVQKESQIHCDTHCLETICEPSQEIAVLIRRAIAHGIKLCADRTGVRADALISILKMAEAVEKGEMDDE